MRRLTTSEFIERASKIHQNLYNYDKVEYVNGTTPVCIIDPEYGEFWQKPQNHLAGKGNPQRGRDKVRKLNAPCLETFVRKAQEVHGDLYDYSKVVYKGNKRKVLIIDPDYGEFWQTPSDHLSGNGNPERGLVSRADKRRHTLDEFISKAKEIHGDLYDYSLVDYINSNTKVLIIDPEFGEFWQTPASHLTGRGNPVRAVRELGERNALTTGEFIGRAKEIHGNLYDYSKVEYVNMDTRVLIIDPDYGEFWQTPSAHLQGSGNPKRWESRRGESSRLTTEEFIRRARVTHGDFYDYSKVKYKDAFTKVLIIDPEFGEFWQQPSRHIFGQGNPIRGRETANRTLTMTQEEFEEKANQVHSGLYDYSKSTYTASKEKILIVDPKYGEFWQTPNNHLQGAGHPKRASVTSEPENKLAEWVRSLGLNLVSNDRGLIHPYELDILIPEHNVAIEIDGVFSHSSRFKDRYYHQRKQQLAEGVGVELLQFWCTEVNTKWDIVTSIIMNKLGMTPHRVFARNTEVVELTPSVYREFLSENHLQGALNSRVKLGLVQGDTLLAVIGMSKRHGSWVIDRFASKLFHNVVGGFSKLLSRLPGDEIVTHSANRYATGGTYLMNGFTLKNEHPYTMFFSKNNKIYSRETFQRHKLKGLPNYSEDKTTDQILREINVLTLYAAGTKTWVLNRG